MIKCIDCKFNTAAQHLGEDVRLCLIPLPIGLVRRCRINDEKKYGCVLGVRKEKEDSYD